MLTAALRLLCRLLFRVRLHGRVQLPQNGRLLLVANHESFLDGLLIGAFLPFRATFVIHTSVLDNWFFRQCFRYIPHLAVDHASPLGIKQIIRLVESGTPVLIFPEGRITNTASLMKIYEGPGLVAARTGATLLPICVRGAACSRFGRLSPHFPRRWLPRVELWFAAPTRIDMPVAPTGRQRRKLAGDALRRIMQDSIAAANAPRTLFDALLDAIALYGRKRPIMEDVQKNHDSYGSLLKKSLALGRLLARTTPGNAPLGVLLPNGNATVCLIFGLSAQGRTPAMLNYTAGAEGMRSACRAAAIDTIVTSRQFVVAAGLGATVAALAPLRLVYLEDLRGHFRWHDKLWLMLYALRWPRRAASATDPDDTAVILFTSGSEGRPKGVALSHRAILANVAQIRAVIDFSPQDKFFVALPLFHSFGFTAGAILPLVSGARLFLYPTPLHYRVIPEIVYDRNCTVLFGTSTFLGHYGRLAHPYDFHRLRHVVAGAEKLHAEVRQQWMEKFGIRILEGYGSTECAPVLAVNTPMAHRIGSVGTLMPLVRYHLLAVPGIARGGLLHVRGPNLMRGYYTYDQPGVLLPTRSQLGDGWYDTGDVVDIDHEGFVHILGRLKRFAKVAGEMIALETVERIASLASPDHRHAACSQADRRRGECILLFTTDFALTREALLAAAHALGLPELAVARKIMIVAELPLLGSGKVDYVALKSIADAAS